jgi:hypothetical protein
MAQLLAVLRVGTRRTPINGAIFCKRSTLRYGEAFRDSMHSVRFVHGCIG